MPIVTDIREQKRSPNRRSVYLDGAFAFGCNLNVIARFRLRAGLALCAEEIEKIQLGEVKQECFDSAMRFLESRLHSRAELKRKLMRREWGEAVITAVLDDLQRMDYLNDRRFASTKASSAAQHKHHGKKRAYMELLRSGVAREDADAAVTAIYSTLDSCAMARDLALKQLARLKKLDPATARRRLVGMLQRRGFDYESIKPVVDEVLGDRGVARD